MQLFYHPDITKNDAHFSFDKDESRHIVKVLRRKVGDELNITNGKGWLFKAELTQAELKQCSVRLISNQLQPKRPLKLHLAVAPTKMNDRFEWFLEKATEIGIEEITPIICNNSERKIIKTNRIERIIQSAMKQSLSCYLPKLNAPVPFNQLVDKNHNGQLFIAHCAELKKESLKSALTNNSDCLILIGPEGDFSTEEIDRALANGFSPVTLGNTRLRTETAAIVACHSFAFKNE